MTVQGLMEQGIFNLVNEGDGLEREITTPFCCDLLSIAMGRAPAGCACDIQLPPICNFSLLLFSAVFQSRLQIPHPSP